MSNFTRSGRPEINGDGLFFLFSGRSWVTNGVTPYRNLIDIKPPVTHEFAALIAVISGGDPFLMAFLADFTTSAAVVGIVVLVGQLAYQQARDPRAAYAAGTAVLFFPLYYSYPGFRPKYFTVAFGLLSVWLLTREQPAGAGASAAVAAGFWQFGAIFPVLVLGQTAVRRDWSATIRSLAGIVVVVIVVILPIALAGILAVGDMLEQVIFFPIIASEDMPLAVRIDKFVAILGPAVPAVIIGVLGALLPAATAIKRRVLNRSRQRADPGLWLSILAGWFILQVFVFDLDAGIDLLPLLACCALGYGALGRVLDEHTILILLSVVTVAVGFGGVSPIQPGPWTHEVGSMQWHYWTATPPSSDCFIKKGFDAYLTGPAREAGLPAGSTCGHDFERIVRIALGLQ
ncbi:DolP-mannose mannosyltransferase [Halocatena marina]|uniref:DolP-mannose mannosyltransferase n=1 Tax=Halocatena marina TaxID=2934937 RepID=A0ABD5YN62_9EURY|nr:DolP-mannose mannosyltransferase [Halocatena marina]